jgi:predicted Zn-dependent peptidase
MINRTTPPPFTVDYAVDVLQARHKTLSNGLQLHFINAGSQDLVKIEFYFYAGTCYQSTPLVAGFTNRLLKEGTSKHSAKELAEIIDFYGAFLENECGHDTALITLYALNKHLKTLLPILQEVMFDAAFPEDEFEVYRNNAIQKYHIRQQKVSDVASLHFGEMIFGQDNFYGYNVLEKDYKNITINDVKKFYAEHYRLSNAVVVISGKVDDSVLDLMQEFFGNELMQGSPKKSVEVIPHPTAEKQQYLPLEGAIQSAIRVGRPLFTKTHPDFLPLLVLNTILGGYFGSRLMANIREDKGYTYGIGSNVIPKIHAGHFYISTEVGADVTNNALVEIYKEIELLRTTLIPAEELELVKNYLTGTFLRSIDGAFSLAQKFTGIYFYQLGYDYYSKYLEILKTISSEDILALANKYLQKEDLFELVVGKK